jgi:hypothetical protein
LSLRAGLGGLGEEKNLLPLPGFEPGTVHPVAWSLCRLRYPSLGRYIPKKAKHNFNQYMSNKLKDIKNKKSLCASKYNSKI